MNDDVKRNVETGEFPYPLTDGPDESRYLTWVRNHSNYMAVRGFLDYLRSVGVLVRGIVINFLTVLPCLLLVSIGLAYAHHASLAEPYVLSFWILVAGVVWILLCPILTPLFRIVRYRRSIAIGSESSVRNRDVYERTFGGFLLAIVTAGAVESLPWVLELVRRVMRHTGIGGTELLAIVTVGLAGLSGADTLLTALKGLSRKLAMTFVASLGLLMPLLVILYVTDFLVYGLPPTPTMLVSPLLVPGIAVVAGIVVAILLGTIKQVFTRSEAMGLSCLLVTALGVLTGVYFGVVWAAEQSQHTYAQFRVTSDELSELASEFEKLPADDDRHAEASEFVRRFVALNRKLQESKQKHDDDPTKEMACLELAREFVELGGEFRELPEEQAEMLRDELSRRSRDRLAEDAYDELHENFIGPALIAVATPHVHANVDERLPRTTPEHLPESLPVNEILTNAKAELRDSLIESDIIEELTIPLQLRDTTTTNTTTDKMGAIDRALERLPVEELARLIRARYVTQLMSRRGTPAADLADLIGGELPAFFQLAAAKAKEAAKDATVATALAKEAAAAASGSVESPKPDNADKKPSVPKLRETITQEEITEIARDALAERALAVFTVDELAAIAIRHIEAAKKPKTDSPKAGKQTDPGMIDLAREALAKYSVKHLTRLVFSPDTPRPRRPDGTPSKQQIADDQLIRLAREELAFQTLNSKHEQVALLARSIITRMALNDFERVDFNRPQDQSNQETEDRFKPAREALAQVSDQLTGEEYAQLAVAHHARPLFPQAADRLVNRLVFGRFGSLDDNDLAALKMRIFRSTIDPKALFIFLLAVVILLTCWLTVDVNITSIHGLYRDRLAAAFLVGVDRSGDVNIEDDLDLTRICRYEARSTAPYHIVNVALNLQGSGDIGIRDRQSDFFIFSRRFIGGERTGYCRSGMMEQVFPQTSLAMAMAISAAAASPNMGRGTSSALVMFMTMLNIRLGYWLPHPGHVEATASSSWWAWLRWSKDESKANQNGYQFDQVFAAEVHEIQRRWTQAYPDRVERQFAKGCDTATVHHGLAGIAFSGGGIRSATINLGIAQALFKYGVFDHFDYMSTVSGGGYLGSSISAIMRSRTKMTSEVSGAVSISIDEESGNQIVKVTGAQPRQTSEYRFPDFAILGVEDGQNISEGTPLLRRRAARHQSETNGTVRVETLPSGNYVVHVAASQNGQEFDQEFSRFDQLAVETGDTVVAGQPLIHERHSLSERFRWRVRPSAFFREMFSRLDENHHWVNLSDGGHIENLATIELLRRRCKYVVIGDGEADPELAFNGLATLIRTARIDLGTEITIDLDALRLQKPDGDESESEHACKDRVSRSHWAVGTITYPPLDDGNGKPETGWLLYLKSSFTGDEGEVIREYRHRNPDFPHQSTADQFFDEGQFEAYRALGQHIGEQALSHAHRTRGATVGGQIPFGKLETWFKALERAQKKLNTPPARRSPARQAKKTEDT